MEIRYCLSRSLAVITAAGFISLLIVEPVVNVLAHDVSPTFYQGVPLSRPARRANGEKRFHREKNWTIINHYPAYLMFSPVLFGLGVLYERLFASTRTLRSLARVSFCRVGGEPGPALPAKTQPEGLAIGIDD